MTEENLDLSKITYLCVLPSKTPSGNNNIETILKIGHETSKGINFYNKIIYTPQKPDCETYDFEVREIKDLSFNQYTPWLLSNLKDLFESEFMINFHADGMIQNRSAWKEQFLDYDYIGAPWEIFINGGNGGFSLRSRALCEGVSEIDLSGFDFNKFTGGERIIAHNEDVVICRTYEKFLKHKGVKFAPTELSCKFSTEHFAHEEKDFYDSFGFHEIEAIQHAGIRDYRRDFLKNILT